MRRSFILGLVCLVLVGAGTSAAAEGSLRLLFSPEVTFGLNMERFSQGFDDDFMIGIGGLAWVDEEDYPLARLELGWGAFSDGIPGVRAMARVSLFSFGQALLAAGFGASPIRHPDSGRTYVSVCAEAQVLVTSNALGAQFGKLELGVQIPVGYEPLLPLLYIGVGMEWYF